MITETIEWIPVEERLPDPCQAVLVWVEATENKSGHAAAIGHVRCDEWYGGEAGDELYDVTHWAEIKGPEAGTDQQRNVRIDYTNWRGERTIREVTPVRLWYGANEWHKERQWLLTAVDAKKGERRDFAVSCIHSWAEIKGPEVQK
jgi:hypothetical protein